MKPRIRFGCIALCLAAFSAVQSIPTAFAAPFAPSLGRLPCQHYLDPSVDPLKLSTKAAAVPLSPAPSALAPEKAGTLSPSGVNGYFAMTRKFGGGTFDDLRYQLPKFREMGINFIWVSPVNPQTTDYYAPLSEQNNHGYWILDHSKVDPKLGGEQALLRLNEEAKALGIRICIDIVLNHFGYLPEGSKVPITPEGVSIDDPEFFKSFDRSGPFVLARQEFLYRVLDSSTDPAALFAAQRELAQMPLYKLNSLRHENPLVRAYLTKSVKKLIDLGFSDFRVDALKHWSFDFFVDLVNELNDYAALQGKKLTFVVELLLNKSNTLSLFAEHILSRIRDNSRVYFIDFPMAHELRRLEDYSYQFSWLMSFHRYRDQVRASGVRLNDHLIPMIEDHDFGYPIKGTFEDRLAYTVTEFLSQNSTITHHGTEQSGNVSDKRAQIDDVRADGDIQRLKNKMAQALAPYRLSQGKDVLIEYWANNDWLVLERKLPNGRSVVLAVNKGYAHFSTDIVAPTSQVAVHVNEGISLHQSPVHFESSSNVSISLPPRSFVVFERAP